MVIVRDARHPALGEMALTEVMAALSDPIRVGLVRLLSDGCERGWGELRAPLSKSTLSHHLRVLRNAGITRTRQEGTRCYVVLRRDDLQVRFPGLLDAVLAAANSEDVGRQVSLATRPEPRPMLTTRVGSVADAAAVARLWTAANLARHAETGLPLGPVAGEDIAEAEQQVHRRLADPAAFAVLADDDGELVAMALVMQALDQDGASPDPLPGLAHVSMVAVHPDRWGHGLAALVLDLAHHDARKRGFARAQLWTHETNRRAQRLYERLGWVASGRTKIDDHGEPIRHYIREL